MAYTGPKKFKKKVGNKTVRYGHERLFHLPGTKKGDSYCSRSAGQMKKHPKAAKTRTVHCALVAKSGSVPARKSRRT